MRPVCWLHISDIHLSSRETWSQDVVLEAMRKQIEAQRQQGTTADFILLTGDIAFSGQTKEYALAVDFLDALCAASGVPKERVFCIPGNHDIDRYRQDLCFRGARASLRDPSRVDEVLGGGEDLETLLKRQENYRRFQEEYFSGQERTLTDDGLGYVARLTIEDVRFAIMGLDSAWLAYGGNDDHGHLLVGERQVINAVRLVQQGNEPAHIVIAIAHHPFHLLQEFDRRTVMNRIEGACHFLHCGHLHEPEARITGIDGTGCLTLAAGASYQTRQSHNSYSIVTLDLLRAVRTVQTFQYRPADGSFSDASSDEYRIEVMPAETCGLGELAEAMSAYDAGLADRAYYLSALILDRKAELVIPAENGHSFASFAVLQESTDSDLKDKTEEFLRFRNVLHVLYQHVPLPEVLMQHGGVVAAYGAALRHLCDEDSALGDRLDEQERDARVLAATSPATAFSHTSALLTELAEVQDWAQLREQAERHMDSPDPGICTLAKRMMALSLANSDEPGDKEAAIELYRSIKGTASAEFSDTGNLAILLAECGNNDEAKAIVLEGMKKFSDRAEYFSEIGQRLVAATGDKDFRKQMEAAIAERGKNE